MAQLNSGIAQIAALRTQVATLQPWFPFSQGSNAPAVISTSQFVPVEYRCRPARVRLTTNAAPVGSALTVQFWARVNGTDAAFAVLQIDDGSTTAQRYDYDHSWPGLLDPATDDGFYVKAVSVGSSVAAQGVYAPILVAAV